MAPITKALKEIADYFSNPKNNNDKFVTKKELKKAIGKMSSDADQAINDLLNYSDAYDKLRVMQQEEKREIKLELKWELSSPLKLPMTKYQDNRVSLRDLYAAASGVGMRKENVKTQQLELLDCIKHFRDDKDKKAEEIGKKICEGRDWYQTVNFYIEAINNGCDLDKVVGASIAGYSKFCEPKGMSQYDYYRRDRYRDLVWIYFALGRYDDACKLLEPSQQTIDDLWNHFDLPMRFVKNPNKALEMIKKYREKHNDFVNGKKGLYVICKQPNGSAWIISYNDFNYDSHKEMLNLIGLKTDAQFSKYANWWVINFIDDEKGKLTSLHKDTAPVQK
jgi:hypothetical protein